MEQMRSPLANGRYHCKCIASEILHNGDDVVSKVEIHVLTDDEGNPPKDERGVVQDIVFCAEWPTYVQVGSTWTLEIEHDDGSTLQHDQHISPSLIKQLG